MGRPTGAKLRSSLWVPRHPQKFKKPLLETNFYHDCRLNFHIYKRRAPPLFSSSFAIGRGLAWIDGCSLAGGQQHAACMRRDADACCMHETRCCVWSRALAIRPVARHMRLLCFCRARRTRARDWQNIHGRIQLTLPTGYYVRHAGF